jgi:peroxiredoxin
VKSKLLVTAALLLPSMALAAAIGYRQYDQPWPAMAFQLTDLSGETHSLAGYRGKVVILNFWASWCRPCVSEMPSLQRTWEQLKSDNVQVLGIAVGEQNEDIQRFLKKHAIVFPLLADGDSSVTGKWRVPGLPTTFIVNKEGLVVTRIIGAYEWDSPESLHYLKTLSRAD